MVNSEIVIAGGGIAGLAAAVALKKSGFETKIIEQTPTFKPVGAGVVIAVNAMKAFAKIGIGDQIIQQANPLERMEILDEKGKLITGNQLDKIAGDYRNYAIKRHILHEVLLTNLNKDQIRLGKSLEDAISEDGRVNLQFTDGSSESCGLLLVAEGIHSKIRKNLIPTSEEKYSGYACWRGLSKGIDHVDNIAYESWGKGKRFGMVPLGNGEYYWFAVINSLPNSMDNRRLVKEEIASLFKEFHDPVVQIIINTDQESIIYNDINDFDPINQYAFNRILLMGDSAHATTPNMGQGACQAIEDAVILAEILKSSIDYEKAFKQFEQVRIPRVKDIVIKSRQLGTIAQWENPLLTQFRNTLFRFIPESIFNKNLKKIYDFQIE